MTSGLSMEGMLCLMVASHIHLTIMSIVLINDLKKKDWVELPIILEPKFLRRHIGRTQFVIYRRNINHILKVC